MCSSKNGSALTSLVSSAQPSLSALRARTPEHQPSSPVKTARNEIVQKCSAIFFFSFFLNGFFFQPSFSLY